MTGPGAVQTDGARAVLSIHGPLTQRQVGVHSLAEIAVYIPAGTGFGDAVEVGWIIDRNDSDQLGDGTPRPRLFTFHWVNSQPQRYNDCLRYRGRVRPGARLSGTAATTGRGFAIIHDDARNRWNLYYRGRAFCFYPDSRWDNGFSSANEVQLFGEVTDFDERPCSAMGNGQRGTDPAAARFRDIRFSGGTPNGGLVENEFGRDDDQFYNETLINAGVRFGGPRPQGC